MGVIRILQDSNNDHLAGADGWAAKGPPPASGDFDTISIEAVGTDARSYPGVYVVHSRGGLTFEVLRPGATAFERVGRWFYQIAWKAAGAERLPDHAWIAQATARKAAPVALYPRAVK